MGAPSAIGQWFVAALVVWIGLTSLAFVSLGPGTLRATIVVFMTAIGVVVVPRTSKEWGSSALLSAPRRGRAIRIGVVLMTVVVLVHIGRGIGTARRYDKTGQIQHDQAQNIYRAIRLLVRGDNPYALGLLLDPYEYNLSLADPKADGCILEAPDRAAHFWQVVDDARQKRDGPRNAGVRRRRKLRSSQETF